jgi:uncharacterized protein
MSKGRSVPAPSERAPGAAPVQSTIEKHPAIPGLARAAVDETLAGAPGLEQVDAGVTRAVELATSLVDELAASEPVACRAGCAWCCSTTVVSTSAAEVVRIARYQLRQLTERLRQRAGRIAALDPERRRHARLPCALLVNNRCSVYDVRPLSCMGWTSADAAACERSYRSGWERQIPNGPRHLGIVVGVREGLHQALDARRLDAEYLDLTRALLIALTEPDAAERWLRGEAIFAPARL